MKASLVGALVLGLGCSLSLVGCDTDKSKVETERTVETPNGESTVSQETEIKQSGDNPPPVDTTVPPSPDENNP